MVVMISASWQRSSSRNATSCFAVAATWCLTTWSSMRCRFAEASFSDLISNAIKYTPGGRVTIGQGKLARRHRWSWVSDNGAGIPAVLLDEVFEKRETDPEEAEGNGLGLAIVKTFIEAHSGAVIVESKEGCGSTFRFSLPCKVESPDGLHSVVGGEPQKSEEF